jgi:hypothetical protein
MDRSGVSSYHGLTTQTLDVSDAYFVDYEHSDIKKSNFKTYWDNIKTNKTYIGGLSDSYNIASKRPAEHFYRLKDLIKTEHIGSNYPSVGGIPTEILFRFGLDPSDMNTLQTNYNFSKALFIPDTLAQPIIKAYANGTTRDFMLQNDCSFPQTIVGLRRVHKTPHNGDLTPNKLHLVADIYERNTTQYSLKSYILVQPDISEYTNQTVSYEI